MVGTIEVIITILYSIVIMIEDCGKSPKAISLGSEILSEWPPRAGTEFTASQFSELKNRLLEMLANPGFVQFSDREQEDILILLENTSDLRSFTLSSEFVYTPVATNRHVTNHRSKELITKAVDREATRLKGRVKIDSSENSLKEETSAVVVLANLIHGRYKAKK